MAYSAGFSPHPKISYAGAAPTGAASEAEYLEIGLAERCDPERLRAALDACLSPGLDVLEVVEASAGSLVDRLEASHWRVRLDGVHPVAAAAAVAAFNAAERVEVARMMKNGLRTFDAREAVVELRAGTGRPALPMTGGDSQAVRAEARFDDSAAARRDGQAVRADADREDSAPERGETRDVADPCAILDMVVRHLTPAVRPDDVLTGLRLVADLVPPSPPVVTRLAQGPLDPQTGLVGDPLVSDRATATSAPRLAVRVSTEEH